MKRLFAVALGILTAIGGFVDIGDIVANAETGARFGMSLAWVVVGICLFAEMAGRVATVSGRATFDLDPEFSPVDRDAPHRSATPSLRARTHPPSQG